MTTTYPANPSVPPRLSARSVRRVILAALVAGTATLGNGSAHAAQVTITSSDATFNASAAWAVDMANHWVQHGTLVPAYWAGGQNRAAFYSRDTAHQTVGAHLLGLDLENFSMLRSLASSSVAARLWYPFWSMGFDGTAFIKDYRGDTSFVRELPAPFELVQKAYEQYLWTGNQDYLNDPTLWAYYGHIVNEFVAAHDQNSDGIADENGNGDLFGGVASYNENGEHLVVGGDSLGSQYQAFVAYAGLLRAKGMATEADAVAARAEALRATFNTTWWSDKDQTFIRGFDNTGAPKTDYGKESSFFLLMKLLPVPGPRTDAYLDFVDQSSNGINIEASTYLPDAFYPYGRVVEGWNRLTAVFNSRSDYPEVSYSALGNTVAGLMGVEADVPDNEVRTLPRLPTALAWVQADHVMVGLHEISVKHEGCGRTIFAHTAGPGALTWTARFYGSVTLQADGAAVTGNPGILNGRALTEVRRSVAVGATSVVETVGTGQVCDTKPVLQVVDGGTSAPLRDGGASGGNGGVIDGGLARDAAAGSGGSRSSGAGGASTSPSTSPSQAASGCGCTLGGVGGHNLGWATFALSALVLTGRLRRRRRPSRR